MHAAAPPGCDRGAYNCGDTHARNDMQQLSGQDASFIYLDSTQGRTHVGMLGIYDQSTAPSAKVRFKDIIGHVESRLGTAGVFRQKLVRVPMDLDNPWWVDDEDFDIEFHVRHIALPRPGDWRQFCILVARLHSRPLDMARPLWEMNVIEGLNNIPWLPKSSFAIYTKMHHAAVDGHTGTEITAGMHDTSPEPAPRPPRTRWRPEPGPGQAGILVRAGLNNVITPVRMARHVFGAAPGLAKTVLKRFTGGEGDERMRVPRTRFNGKITQHRVVDGTRFSLEEVSRVRVAVAGSTVNDVVLSIAGGALRRYLEAKDELPGDSLVAFAPINVRRENERNTGGNQVSLMRAALRTDIADPVERLAAVHRGTSRSKEITNAIGARELTDLNKYTPPATLALAGRLITRAALLSRTPLVNCVVTNVPGAQVPLYLNGARLLSMGGLGPIVNGMGLIIVVVSYNGELTMTLTSDREMVPDPAFFTECINESWSALKSAAAKAAGPAKKSAPRKKKSSRPAASGGRRRA